MDIFWRETRRGQRLVLVKNDESYEEEIGGVRETKRGFDAFAKTFGYEPGRSIKGLDSLDQGREFVESFQPWDLYDLGRGLVVEPEVREASN